MFRDRVHEALQVAAVPTLERIHCDARQLPARLLPVLQHVESHLFEPALNVNSVRRATGIKDHSLSTVFGDYVGRPLRAYIETCRLEVAERLLRTTSLQVGQISLAVGYDCHSTFIRAFTKLTGKKPSEVRRQPPEPTCDYATWLRAWGGELSFEESVELLDKYSQIYPKAAAARLALGPRSGTEPVRIEVDGSRFERFRAQELWQEIGTLPAEVQRQRVRRHRFHSSALFDLLREKSRTEGRRDRQRGIELAELALATLEGGEEVYGERVHDLRALGWAWLGNAHRLALDFSAADLAFDKADVEWAKPRRHEDDLVCAEIFSLKGSLRMMQRAYAQALKLVEDAREVFRRSNCRDGEIKSLIRQAAIQGYSGKPHAAIRSLATAKDLINEQTQPFVTFAIFANLATDFAREGRFRAAAAHLKRAKSLQTQTYNPLGFYDLQWTDAYIHQGFGRFRTAERLYLSALSGFSDAQAVGRTAVASVDLAILYSEQDQLDKALRAATQTVSILESIRIYPESLLVATRLANELSQQMVSFKLLLSLRRRLLKDPLTGLAQERSKSRKNFPAP